MPTMELTKEQLAEQIKAVVLPMVENHVGAAVKNIVEANLQKTLENQSKAFMTPFMDALNERKKEVVKWDKGIKAARFVRAAMNAKINGMGRKGVIEVLKEWKEDEMALEVEMHQKALAATDAVAGGFLVPQQYSNDIIELLRNKSVIRQAGPTVIQMSTGTFRIPKVTEGSVAYYIGENQPIPPSQPAFGQLTLTFKKLACLVPMSNDLLRYSSPGADAIVRDDMVREMADTENDAFLRGDGMSGTPRGLLNWVLPDQLITGNGTASLDNFIADMGKLLLVLMGKNIPLTKPVWIFAPRTWNYAMNLNTSGIFPFRDELKGGTFWGWPYFMSNSVPINQTIGSTTLSSEIYLVDMADVVLGESMNLTVDASQEAAYAQGGTMVSAFQNDQTVIRSISEHDLAMRRQESLAILQGVIYGK